MSKRYAKNTIVPIMKNETRYRYYLVVPQDDDHPLNGKQYYSDKEAKEAAINYVQQHGKPVQVFGLVAAYHETKAVESYTIEDQPEVEAPAK